MKKTAKPSAKPKGARRTVSTAAPAARASRPKPIALKPAQHKPADVKVTAAKGRPMLTWVGKRPLTHVTAFPAQHVEQFSAGPAPERIDWSDWPAAYPPGGLL